MVPKFRDLIGVRDLNTHLFDYFVISKRSKIIPLDDLDQIIS